MMDEDGEDLPPPSSPFWLKTTSNLGVADRYRHRVTSLFFNSTFLLLLLLSTAMLFIVFVIPPILNFTSHIFKPNSIKKSWDSLNLVLVLFALAIGFLSRNRNEDPNNGYHRVGSNASTTNGGPRSNSSTPRRQRYDFPDQTSNAVGGLRRHRTSSSYPDLRQFSTAVSGDEPWRFSDDTQLGYQRVYGSGYSPRDRISREVEKHVLEAEEDSHAPPQRADDTNAPSLAESEAVHAPPQSVRRRRREKRVHESLEKTDKERAGEFHADLESEKILTREVELPPPTPPSPPPEIQEMDRDSERSDRKRRGSSSNLTKDFLTSFYKKKKKRQRNRSLDNFDSLMYHSQPPPLRFELQPSSPPPPPPSVFHNIFSSKKDKRKKVVVDATENDTPQPVTVEARKRRASSGEGSSTTRVISAEAYEERTSAFTPNVVAPESSVAARKIYSAAREKSAARVQPTQGYEQAEQQSEEVMPEPSVASRAPKQITRVAPFTTVKPQMPVKLSAAVDESSSGGETPLRKSKIPPPPPLPPFKMADWKFVVEGDYVRLQSSLSSRSGSPELDEVESPLSNALDDGDVPSPSSMFCPSPDVDTKADNFIAKFRAGLKLEKINSFNQNQAPRMSNLGPGTA